MLAYYVEKRDRKWPHHWSTRRLVVDPQRRILFVSKRDDLDLWYFTKVRLEDSHGRLVGGDASTVIQILKCDEHGTVFCLRGYSSRTTHRRRSPSSPSVREVVTAGDSVRTVDVRAYPPSPKHYEGTFRCAEVFLVAKLRRLLLGAASEEEKTKV